MEVRELTCIGCPLGCAVTVETEDKEIISIRGNTCKRGETYAKNEVLHPVRTLTGTVRVSGGTGPVVSVKTRSAIPKEKIFECAGELSRICVKAPVRMGDTILSDAAGTGVDIVATKAMGRA